MLELFFFLLHLAALLVRAEGGGGGEDDLVSNVPGLSFKPNYKTYSGYLYANEKKTWKIHYM